MPTGEPQPPDPSLSSLTKERVAEFNDADKRLGVRLLGVVFVVSLLWVGAGFFGRHAPVDRSMKALAARLRQVEAVRASGRSVQGRARGVAEDSAVVVGRLHAMDIRLTKKDGNKIIVQCKAHGKPAGKAIRLLSLDLLVVGIER